MKLDRRITNLIITGFSGTGKSLVAKEAARGLNWDFLDTDDEIVKQTGRTISKIFRHDGEDKFRELERETIRKACQQRQTVIAIGGGAIVDPHNYELLAKTGLIVCLEAKPETIYERLFREAAYSTETEVRPLLAEDNPLERIKQLKASRQPYYANVDWTIHTDNLSISQVAKEVIRAWRLLRRTHPHLNTLPSRERKLGSQLKTNDDVACVVETAAQSYPVLVGYGLLDKLGEKMKQAALSGTATIISDENVFSHYGSKVEGILKYAGFAVNSFVVPPGEETKSMDSAIKIYDFLVEHRAERDDIIILHGEAVAIGMVGAAKLSQRLGLLPSSAVERQQALLQKFGLPTSLQAEAASQRRGRKRSNLKLSLAGITRAMELDKKVKGKAIRWVLLQDIGEAVIRSDVPQQDVLAVIRELAEP